MHPSRFFAITVATMLAPLAEGAIQVQSYLSGLSSPIYVTSAKDGTRRMFVVERDGLIKVVQLGSTSPTVFVDISPRVLAGGEQGLLGLAFHPNYPLNRRFFVNYTRAGDGATVIAELQTSPTNHNVARTNEVRLLTIAQPYANHNGGMIEFGPDGYLYIGMGDGGSGNDPGNRAQKLDDLLGKMLRIDVDRANGSEPYSSPADNPFVGGTNRAEIWAYGLRNPWRWSFDRRGTHQLFLGDVGQEVWEETDIITRGGNYGWRIMEGNHCNPGLSGGVCTAPTNHTAPIAEYSQASGRCSITGGYVYRGVRNTVRLGTYVSADYCTGEIFELYPAAAGGTLSMTLDTSLLISSFGEDEAAELYVVHLNGTVGRLAASPAPVRCVNYSITPTNLLASAVGATGAVSIQAGADCAWMAASHADWITIDTREGQSNGTIRYTVSPNTSNQARRGRIWAAGHPFVIDQEGAIQLSIQRTGSQIEIIWPTNGFGYTLESTGTLPPPSWTRVDASPVVRGVSYVVSESIAGSGRYYRLRKP